MEVEQEYFSGNATWVCPNDGERIAFAVPDRTQVALQRCA